MPEDTRLDSIPTGLTCEGVHRAIVEYLLTENQNMTGVNMLDIPCGNGELISSLRRFFPAANVRGCDLEKPAMLTTDDFAFVDASRTFVVFPDRKFDYVFSVSGVMEFDNTLQFFENCYHHLREGGQFIVTNDNLVTIRDRLSYFWLGKARQFQLFVNQGQETWKLIPIHNLIRILRDAGFTIRKLDYVSVRPKDWLLLPLALLIYPIQAVYIRLTRNSMTLAEKYSMYPFRSLLYRHYIIVCDKLPA
jgi:2-polyprenyl-3-methyl-5-hydroxy-6-metoxy-1,4-benzoquinol methylase